MSGFTEEWLEQRNREVLGVEKRSKYNARKKIVDGITFDSTREAKRYQELKVLERCGDIAGLKLQPAFELQPRVKLTSGRIQRAINYRADFEYIDGCGNQVVEDVKGMKTPVYLLKVKLLRWKYPSLIFREVK